MQKTHCWFSPLMLESFHNTHVIEIIIMLLFCICLFVCCICCIYLFVACICLFVYSFFLAVNFLVVFLVVFLFIFCLFVCLPWIFKSAALREGFKQKKLLCLFVAGVLWAAFSCKDTVVVILCDWVKKWKVATLGAFLAKCNVKKNIVRPKKETEAVSFLSDQDTSARSHCRAISVL